MSEQRYKDIFNAASVAIMAEDCSDVKKAINGLKASGVSDFEKYLDENPDFVHKAAQMLKILDVNDAALKLFGAKNKTELLTSIDKVFTPTSFEVLKKELVAIAEGESCFVAEDIIKTLQGECLHILLAVTLPQEESEYQDRLAVIIDITARKRAEDALRISEERFRLLAENARDIIYRYEFIPVRRFAYVSPAVTNITGYTPEEHYADADLGLKIIHQDDRPLLDVFFKGIVESGKPVVVRWLHKNGAVTWTEQFNTPFFDEQGKLIAIEGIARDITERKRMESELLKNQKLESLSVLAGGIAHDFNNVLTGILGSISLARIQHTGLDDNKLSKTLAEAEKGCFRAKELTHQLITFAKGGAPVKKTISLADLIRDSATFSLSGSGTRPEFYITEDLWPADVDEGQISQVINNLVLNAEQAMQQGGIVEIRCENAIFNEDVAPLQKGRYVKIGVRDYGTGIPKENLQRIFDPYFTTKQKGSGLGLATTYSIIRNHNGQILVESEPGRGATFSIFLPASEKEPVGKTNVKEEYVISRGKILIMDDEAIVRDVAGKMLLTLGYEADFAEDGKTAIERYKKAKEANCPYDVIIMDLTIPGGMGGKDAISKLLEIDPSARAIVSSGYSQDMLISDNKKYGFRGFITKPYTMAELSRVVSDVIKGEDCR